MSSEMPKAPKCNLDHLTKEAARDFRLQLRLARENALKDAEAFDGIIHAVERLGSFLFGEVDGLGPYQSDVEELAKLSALAYEVPEKWRYIHIPFSLLYRMVKDARNDALHMGAFARHLTTHAIQLALILEDALMEVEGLKYVSDYMVNSPVCAHLWQPVSLIRQQMLTNSFSYLPVENASGKWCLVSDHQIARFLQGISNGERKRRLAKPLKDAAIEPLEPTRLIDTHEIGMALAKFDGEPILVFRGEDTHGHFDRL